MMMNQEELKCCRLKQDGEHRGWIVDEKGKSERWIYRENRSTDKYKKLFSSPIRKFFKEVFLPRGFPESVHADYVPYQIWDTVQAFASTILGTLTTHSIMRGVGVGESTATPLAAAITWILKDGTGMIGRILFAWWNGPELDAQCKKWRLFADVVNDAAMGIELSLPYFPSHSTLVLCISSVMKSLVGVAGGATRAAITQHQALADNLADVSAKDGSQETCVNLIASLVGIFLLSHLDASCSVGFYYAILVGVHIYANYSAVRSLRFNTFNEDRLALVVKNYLTKSIVPSPDEINRRESVLLFQRPSRELCGFDIALGGSIDKLMESIKTDSAAASGIARLLTAHRNKRIVSHPNQDGIPPSGMTLPDVKTMTIFVALDENCKPRDIVNLYFEAFVIGTLLSMDLNSRPDLIRESETSLGLLSKLSPSTIRDENCNVLIWEEIRKWSRLLDASEWVQERNLLPVGPYRSDWNDEKSK